MVEGERGECGRIPSMRSEDFVETEQFYSLLAVKRCYIFWLE
jgi:hypothetical protein